MSTVIDTTALLGTLTPEERLDVVKATTTETTHNISTSGVSIAISMGGMVLLPVQSISSFGYVFFIGAMTAVFVALTLQPALLFLFFNFFEVTAADDWRRICRGVRRVAACFGCCSKKKETYDDGTVSPAPQHHYGGYAAVSCNDDEEEEEEAKKRRG